MAYGSTLLGADAAFNADKPIFVANQAITPTSVIWYNDAAADISDRSFSPPELCVDGSPGIITMATILGAPSAYIDLVFDFGVGTEIDFDVLGFIHTNMGETALGSVKIETTIADDIAFTINTLLVDTTTFVTNARKLKYQVYTFDNVQFMRLRFIKTVGSFAINDQLYLGQLIAGLRMQMSRQPDEPFAPLASQSSGSSVRSTAGGVVRYVPAKGLLRIQPGWTPTGQDGGSLGTYDNEAILNAIMIATQGWALPFAWCPEPSTNADHFYWCQEATMMHAITFVSGNRYKKIKLTFQELAPGYLGELHGW